MSAAQRNAHMGARAVKMLIQSNPLHSGGMSKEMGGGAEGLRGGEPGNKTSPLIIGRCLQRTPKRREQ